MFFAYIFATLLSLLLIGLSIRWLRNFFVTNQSQSTLPTPLDPNRIIDPECIFATGVIGGGEPEYAVIDFQATGLSTMPGKEDRVLQVACLLLDKELTPVDRMIALVRQETLGPAQAQAVHHIHASDLEAYGQPEEQVMNRLWSKVREVPTLVFHNAEYDLAIWLGSLRTFAPERIPLLQAKKTVCTMLHFTAEAGEDTHYPSLIALTSRLSGLPPRSLYTDLPVAWRNVCLTRYCLSRIIGERSHLTEPTAPPSV